MLSAAKHLAGSGHHVVGAGNSRWKGEPSMRWIPLIAALFLSAPSNGFAEEAPVL